MEVLGALRQRQLRGKNLARRGVALAVALMVALLLIIIALSTLTFAERDSWFEVTMEHELMAYAAARSGLEFYKVESEQFGPNTSMTKNVSTQGYLEVFTVSTDSNGTVTCVGSVETPSGHVLAQKTLICPDGDMNRIFDTSL